MSDHSLPKNSPWTVEQAVQILQQGEAKYRILSDFTNDTIWAVDLIDERFTYVSPSVFRLRGFTQQEVLGQTLRDALTPQSYQLIEDNLSRSVAAFMAGDKEAGYAVTELDLYHKNGSIIHTEVSSSFITNADDLPIAILAVSRDITQCKRAQEALQRSGQELRQLNHIAAVITSSLSFDEVLSAIFKAAPEIFPQPSHTTVQLIDEKDGMLHSYPTLHSQEDEQSIIFAPGEGVAGWVFENRTAVNVGDVTQDPRFVQRPSLNSFLSLMSAPLILYNNALGVLSLTSPIPHAFDSHHQNLLENLAAYAAIALQNARLFEQTRRDASINKILLKEVNHRVKNNLASILAIINMELNHLRQQTNGKTPQQILFDLRERIRGLMVTHDILSGRQWQSASVQQLLSATCRAALTGMTVKDKIHITISVAHEEPIIIAPASDPAGGSGEPLIINAGQSGNQLSPEEEPLVINVTHATNLALVINELLTNAAKYAFPKQAQGKVWIFAKSAPGSNDLLITYKDNGVGWPDDVLTGKRENLGLSLIRSAVQDKLTFYNNDGAQADLVFIGALLPK